jgi:hypothetical protein
MEYKTLSGFNNPDYVLSLPIDYGLSLYKAMIEEEKTKALIQRWIADKQTYEIVLAGQKNRKPFPDFATYIGKSNKTEKFTDAEKEMLLKRTEHIKARLGGD